MSTSISVNIKTSLYSKTGIEFLRMEATTKELSDRNIGKLIKSSCDYGCVHFSFEVEDEVVAKAKAILVVARRFPGHSYTVDVIKPKVSKDIGTRNKVTDEITSRYEFKRSSGRGMETEPSKPAVLLRKEKTMRTLISVNVQVDGKLPTDKEIENRNAVISELSDQNLGKFIKAGSTMGSMDFSYEVHDEKAARAIISKTLSKHLPGWQHSIQSSPRKTANNFVAANDRGQQPNLRQNDVKRGFGMGM